MIHFVSLVLLLAQHQKIERLVASGAVVEVATPASERLAPSIRIAPGAPPTLGFRLIEGKLRHRFGDLDLVLDDAGH